MWPTSCAQEGFSFFSYKQNLNFDVDCITQCTPGRTQAKIHTVSFNGITPLGGIFISKGSDLKSGHILHSERKPKRKTHKFKHRYRHTHASATVNASQVTKANSFTSPEKHFHVRRSSREQLKGHIPSTECRQIIKASQSNK